MATGSGLALLKRRDWQDSFLIIAPFLAIRLTHTHDKGARLQNDVKHPQANYGYPVLTIAQAAEPAAAHLVFQDALWEQIQVGGEQVLCEISYADMDFKLPSWLSD